ncbi:MAG TPA: carboxymuconolactone decarboxylase family protein [Polyangiales bacterium]|nr:carboxymuconolactone decarboxylase family protein [Polyangiales bacterium]
MQSARFTAHTEDTAPEAARPILEASQRQFGFLPAPVAHAAESPALLKHMMASFAAFDHSSLNTLEREVVAMTVAYEVGCHYCMAMHSALLTPDAPQLVAALRAGTQLPDQRLQALSEFVQALVKHHGQVPEQAWSNLIAAGFTRQQALDGVLGTAVYLLSTYTNVLTAAPLDPAFEAFRWTKSA